MVEIGSQHLADNDSIHGSLRNSFDQQNEADIGVSMVVTNKVQENVQEMEDLANTKQLKETKRVYDKFMKSKRKQKTLEKGLEEVPFMVPCNLRPDL